MHIHHIHTNVMREDVSESNRGTGVQLFVFCQISLRDCIFKEILNE